MSNTRGEGPPRTVTLTTSQLHATPTAPIPNASRAERVVVRSDVGHREIVLMRQTRALAKP